MADKGKQMPVGGKVIFGNATGQPKETSQMITGNDLRTGKKGK